MRSSLQYRQPLYTQDNRAVQKPFWARHAKEKSLKDLRQTHSPDQAPLPHFIAREPQVIYDQPAPALYAPNLRAERNLSLARFRDNWLYEEITFSMNKLSLTGLVFGLMVLGVVFFAIGFLSALFTMTPGGTPQPASQSASVWDRINNDIHKVENSQVGQNLETRAGYALSSGISRHGGAAGQVLAPSVEVGVDRAVQSGSEQHYPAYGYPTQPSPSAAQNQPSPNSYAPPTPQGNQAQPSYAATPQAPAVAQNLPDARVQPTPTAPQQGNVPYNPTGATNAVGMGTANPSNNGYGPQPASYSQRPTYSHPSSESAQWANQSAMRY